jgi:hypothetical protein
LEGDEKKMKIKAYAIIAACLFVAAQAQAVPELVAGWDFSQSCLAGNLCDEAFQAIQTLSANYSDLDPTNGMGAESAAFGTMHLDGTLGSSNVPGYGGQFNPNDPNLTLNTSAHDPDGAFSLVMLGAEGNKSIMQAEIPGIAYQQHSMYASDAVDAVFAFDSGVLVGSNWEVSFAAQSLGSSEVAVGFSLDGVSYSVLHTEALGTAEEVVSVSLPGSDLGAGYVMLSLSAGDASRIDNLAINAELVPEPGTVLMLGIGLGGLAAFGRRRS